MDNIETESRSALATGSIGARFISQNAVDEAKERREEEWKEAYERIGQEPPPLMKEEEHDGRTLFERLEEQKQLKQDWWDDRMKMKNQDIGKLVRSAPPTPWPLLNPNRPLQHPKPPLKKTVPAKPAKKDMRSLMKGVVVKKKAAKPADKAADKTADKDKKRPAEDDAREAKRRA
ncbi:hypothetical protein CcaverHIS002_0211620 [Cutaneotrichosporon cavernicola]|nr:hypothetical protein CcaverHIS002_0211620 [Cutaneotrichosporon cavernicola]